MLFKDNINALNTIRFINSTKRSVFLTGKAGTGKTTLLKYIVDNTHKETLIAAPTGIAAINARGVTLHSLFQLPFGAFIPDNTLPPLNSDIQVHTKTQLLSKLQMNKAKRDLLRRMELLIIDEVSMLRADMLDAIDTVLRHVRRRQLPFGGVQVLFIGDLLQLPPVVKDEETALMKTYYRSMFFFDALVFNEHKLLPLELTKIYRQNDTRFISILNECRNNRLSDASLAVLNSHYIKNFRPADDDTYIYITTHNRKADTINERELNILPDKVYTYDAEIRGEFPDHMFPVEYGLKLKKGAQVMFLKNDYSGEQKYFNGKIGTVEVLSKQGIKVAFDDGSESVWVDKYTWENKRFTLNKETNEIEEKQLGTFVHFPIKLAWAVTVHKSQGLTFSKAIIDVSDVFAPGQIYVALSRLRSLDGLVLLEEIDIDGPAQNKRLLNFNADKPEKEEIEEAYKADARKYMYDSVMETFDFFAAEQGFKSHLASYTKDEKRSKKQVYKDWAFALYNEFKPLLDVSQNFRKQLASIVNAQTADHNKLKERVDAANGYFIPLFENISKTVFALISELDNTPGVKQFQTELRNLEFLFYSQIQKFHKTKLLIEAILNDADINKAMLMHLHNDTYRKEAIAESSKKRTKQEKKNTREITFEFLQKGMSPEDIAKERNLTQNTIESHLAYYIADGILDARDFVEESKIVEIIDTSIKHKTKSLKVIKENLSDSSITYSDIKFAMATMESR